MEPQSCTQSVPIGAHSHVSDVPNHQVGRITSLETRANVAFFGAFGYELDITQLSEQEKEQIRHQIAFYKENRELLQMGKFYRLESLFDGDGNVTSWMSVSEDQREAIVGRFKYFRYLIMV
jgi:alpha-galactosidase